MVLDIYKNECELPIYSIPNIVQYEEESNKSVDDVGTDYSLSDVGSDSSTDSEGYNSEELEVLKAQKKREITEKLGDYKELYKGMSFKDIPEARKCMKLCSLANKKRLKLDKSDLERLRYNCDIVGCPFVCLISKEKFGGVKIKTLNVEHDCGIAFDNKTIDFSTIAQYFKKMLQDNPKYKVRKMMLDLKRIFELNVSHGKFKREKRMVLKSLDGSFSDKYNKLEAYANELRESNPGSDVIVTLSKNTLEEGRRSFLRMYVHLHTLKMGFNLGLRPFIGLDGTFLKGKAKGQLLVAVGQDSQNYFYPLASAVVGKETKNTWN
ncbi:uncharacterized protein LOC142176728 [Nicotiana tabacum]|uniref:Uncharacterized protein LOC142176728 n=1 Tax=Nicotiana tabacum TaxID=4097 RepID=A0AC58TV02_TOBAC